MSRPSFGAPHFERRAPGCSTLAAAICTAGGGLGDGFMLGGGSSPDCSRWGPPLGFQTAPPWSSGPEMTSANRPPPSTTPLPMLPEERLWLFEFPPPPPPPQHTPPRHDVYYFPPHEHYCPPPPQPSAPSHGGPCIYHPPPPPSTWWSSNEYGDGDILFQLQPPRDPMPPPPPPPPPPPHLLPAPPWGSAWTWSASGMVQEPYESIPISAMEDSDADDDMMYRVERDAPSAPPQPSASPSQRNKPPPQSAIGERDAACSSRRRSTRGGLTSSPTNDSLGFPDEPPTRDSGPAPPSADPWTLRPRAERPEEDDGQSRSQTPINITTLFRGCDDKTSDFMAARCTCSGDMRCGGDTTASSIRGNSGGDPGARMTNITGVAGAGEGCTARSTDCLPAAGATTTATTTTLTTAASALTSSVASSPSPSLPPSTAATTSSAPASSSTLAGSASLPRKMTLSHGLGFRSVPAEQARAKARLCMRAL